MDFIKVIFFFLVVGSTIVIPSFLFCISFVVMIVVKTIVEAGCCVGLAGYCT